MSYESLDRPVSADPDALTVAPATDRMLTWAHREMRHEFSAAVTLIEPELSKPIQGTVRGLSRGGAYFETRRTVKVDTMVCFDLPLETGPLRVRGRVIWTRKAGAGKLPPGLGLKFQDINDEDLERLTEALEDLPMDRAQGPDHEPALDYRFTEPRE